MNLDEKLEQFYNSAMESATNQNIEIIEEYQKSLQQIYSEHKEEELRKSEATYRAESEKLLREKNKEVASELITLKRKLSDRSQELKTNLYEDVSAKLQGYIKTSDYKDLLVKQIKSAKEFAGQDKIIIYINPTDADLKASLEALTGAELTISNRDFIGGTRAVIQEKSILIDNSFLTRMEESKNKFAVN
ncbi:V-type ATP synthase subunit E [Anaerocolumna xylanovorans]|uniref:H+-ATPase subunit E/Vma4 n=1 Tax=Anaerocolumna xylanovorans DSM 12503 TaxID=1121345 RepID=A0A1M7YNQ8_9FIRM|nr:V-type ATP synthase subunit E [Anaerocolumna xylanovorans]SHO54250.1 H+-ATPase subunit E/Vma4 [Anaerocolumna xylanovorans DSM 12503]